MSFVPRTMRGCSAALLRGACAAAAFLFPALGSADTLPASSPYTDPRLLDMPWGRYSFERQAWRGYLETVPAVEYLGGLGVVWNASVPGKSADHIAAELAAAGFRRVRLEIPWGSVRWDETGFEAAAAEHFGAILEALAAHGLRPLILLNAHHLRPCPMRIQKVEVLRTAEPGSRTLTVAGDLGGVAPLTATVMSLADSRKPGPMIRDRHRRGGAEVLELSKPLARRAEAGEKLDVARLRYAPLHPVGDPEFERTTGGWLRYVSLTARFVERHYGSGGFDVEIWNELTFGSAFLDIANYIDAGASARPPRDPLRPGGRLWTLAARTVRALERAHPQVRVIWGFSNTTFFHVPVAQLPPGIDGQSYHPYGTGRRCYAEIARGKEALLLDGSIPKGCIVQPEGYAHEWQQTESLIRLISPEARRAHPPNSAHFAHFITEHGFRPAEIGIEDRAAALRAKEKFVLRAPLLWLNKGIEALFVYALYEPDDSGFGLYRADGGQSPAMRALGRLTDRFAGARPLDEVRPLTLDVRAAAGPHAREGDGTGADRNRVAVLPFQLSPRRFVLAAYVMTTDFPADHEALDYRISIHGVRGAHARVRCYSPLSDSDERAFVIERGPDELVVDVPLTDVPRLIEIEMN